MIFFKRRPKINIEYLGVCSDLRPPEEKRKDYKAEELAMYPAFHWKEKAESDWRKYPIFNQDGSSSCVAQAVSKTLGIENYVEEKKFVRFSARDIYTRRLNFGSPGMWFQDGMRIGHEGATFEQLMPSEKKNESQMNSFSDRTPLTKIVARPGRGGNYLSLPVDIDAIASIVEGTGKGVLLGVRFGPREWNRVRPQILGPRAPYGHAVVVTNATLDKGVPSLVIEDSWGINSGIQGRRIVSHLWFLNKRISAAWYYQDLKNTGTETRPEYTFKRNLRFGLKNDPDVKALQECLAFEKMFPSNVISYTGNFFGITLKAVKLFQETYKKEISKYVGYDISCTGFVGKGTRAMLNELF